MISVMLGARYETDGTGHVYECVSTGTGLSGDRWRRVPPDEIEYAIVERVPQAYFVEAGDGLWRIVHEAYVDLAVEGDLRSTNSLDANLIAALVEPARNRLEYFDGALEEHQLHQSFRFQGWAFSREVGFTCECSGQEREWRISLTQLRERLPAAREAFMAMYNARGIRDLGNFQSAKRRRERYAADRRAKALLHRHLTKEQRWDLRGSKSFTVTGQDGRTYQITEGSCNNVLMLEDGEPRFRLCVVTDRVPVPVYDLMLAQKLLIEFDIRSYLSIAQAYNVRTKFPFPGSLLLDRMPDDSELTRPPPALQPPPARVQVSNEDIDNPGRWVRSRLRRAEEARREHYADDDADAERQAG